MRRFEIGLDQYHIHYSLRPKYCFIKQKCQIQIDVIQCKSTAMPLSTRGINTTRQHFQMRYITWFYLKWLKSYQLSKFKCANLLSKTDFTFLLWLITFEPLDLKQSYIPHLKVLMCGINASGVQWCGCIFILHYTHQKLTLLLHKKALSQ